MNVSGGEFAMTANSQDTCVLAPHCSAVSKWCARLPNHHGPSRTCTRRVLIADDEASIARLIQEGVHSIFDCETALAFDGDETLRRLEAEPFDLLITDMIMPGVHGLELIRTTRERWPSLDIIVMTGYAEDFPYVKVIEAGASDFILKPHPAAELEAKVRRILRERDARDARILAELEYRSLFELSMNGMVLSDPESFQIRDANRAFCELSGRGRSDLIGISLTELVRPDDRQRLRQGLALFLGGGRGVLGDVPLTSPDRGNMSLDISVTYIETFSDKFLLLLFADVTEKREIEKQLTNMAQMDQLTGLANKHTFNMRLEWAVARAQQENFPLTLLAMDLDNFKQCNDTHGHPAGDEVLATVGKVIRDTIRAGGDEGFRCGGDEFAVLLVGANAAIGRQKAENMCGAFLTKKNHGSSLSVGVAQLKQGMNALNLICAADGALYRAKALGKRGVQVAP